MRDGLILAAMRGAGGALAGYWEFPGGKVEPGETPEVALERELREELLCDASIGEHIDTTAHAYDFATINLAIYYATLTEGEPKLTEHEEVRWLKPTELNTVEWAPADIPAVKKIMLQLCEGAI